MRPRTQYRVTWSYNPKDGTGKPFPHRNTGLTRIVTATSEEEAEAYAKWELRNYFDLTIDKIDVWLGRPTYQGGR